MTKTPEWLEENFNRIINAYNEGKLPHALLLIGESGDGAFDVCQALIEKLMCETKGVVACGSCKSCKLMHSNSHPDYLHLVPEGKSETIKVDVIRQLTAAFSGTAQLSGNKVVWLQNVETMNTNAANALLKLLEEPTANSYLILQTAQLGRLLPTIRSRCQIHRLTKPTFEQAQSFLSSKAVAGNLAVILDIVDGQPYRAQTLTEDQLRDWFSREQHFINTTDFTQLAKEINKQDLPTLLRQLLLWVDHAVRVKHRSIIEAPAISPAMQQLLSGVQMVSLFQFRDYIISIIRAVENRANLNAQMVGEQIAARWQNLRRSL